MVLRQQFTLAAAKRFDYYLSMDLKSIPKVELHRHLELSFRHSFVREVAALHGIDVPKSEAEFKAKFLITQPMKDLGAVLTKFLTTQKILSSEEILTRLTREAIEDAVAEGIKILELRYAPTFIQGGHEHLSFEKIHAAIVKGIEQCANLPIAVGLIATIQRILSLKHAENVCDFVIDNKSTFIGVDLADNEVGFDCLPFAPVFVRAKKAGLNVTIHAGEAPAATAGQSVIDAVEKLGATRIGHGLQIVHEARAIEFVKKNKIVLELCPTSNYLTNAIKTLGEHPFRRLMEQGVLTTLNSDDPGIFDIDLVNEYKILSELHKFSAAEFEHINDLAASASFIPLAQKQKVWPRKIL